MTRVNKEAGETFHYYPQFLPGGKQFLYLVRHGEAEKMGIYIGSLDGKPGTPATRIVQTQFKAEYDAGSGRLLYVQGAGMLMAQTAGTGSAEADGRSGDGGGGGSHRFQQRLRGVFGFSERHVVLRAGERGRKGAVRMAGPGGQAVGNDRPAGGGKIRVQPIAGRQPGCLLCRAWPWSDRHLGAGAGGRPEHTSYLQPTPLGRDGRPTGSSFITATQAESTGKRRMGLARRSC